MALSLFNCGRKIFARANSKRSRALRRELSGRMCRRERRSVSRELVCSSTHSAMLPWRAELTECTCGLTIFRRRKYGKFGSVRNILRVPSSVFLAIPQRTLRVPLPQGLIMPCSPQFSKRRISRRPSLLVLMDCGMLAGRRFPFLRSAASRSATLGPVLMRVPLALPRSGFFRRTMLPR